MPEILKKIPITREIKMKKALTCLVVISSFGFSGSALAASTKCKTVMTAIGGYAALKTALEDSVAASGGPSNGGLDFHMWATVVAKDGTVCAVTKTGKEINSQWLGSRVISAQKANTANAFSLTEGLALSSANLWAATQPGGSLFGLQFSNPVDTKEAYDGNAEKFGSAKDPMVGERVGGINVFGGGLGLYNASGELIGGLGVSGDTSCADHNVAWRTRDALSLDHVPSGLSGAAGDNIIYDTNNAFGHPTCGFSEDTVNTQILIDHPLGD